MICRPTSVEPVKTILRTAGWSTSRWPTTLPLPGSTWSTPSGSPASRASSPIRIAVSGVISAGLTTTVLPAASAGAMPQARIGIGKFHGTISADHAQRLVEGHVQPAGHRDLPAEQPLRRRRVVLQHVADVPGLPAGLPDRVPGARDLERGQLVDVRVDLGGEPAQQPGPVAGRDVRQAACAAAARSIAASVSPAVVSSTVRTACSVAGLITVY